MFKLLTIFTFTYFGSKGIIADNFMRILYSILNTGLIEVISMVIPFLDIKSPICFGIYFYTFIQAYKLFTRTIGA